MINLNVYFTCIDKIKYLTNNITILNIKISNY